MGLKTTRISLSAAILAYSAAASAMAGNAVPLALGAAAAAAYMASPLRARAPTALLLALATVELGECGDQRIPCAALGAALFALVSAVMIHPGLLGRLGSALPLLAATSALATLALTADLLVPPSTTILEAEDIAVRGLLVPIAASLATYVAAGLIARRAPRHGHKNNKGLSED